MILYHLRHGEAVPPNGTITDAARTLSDRGRADIERAGGLLSRLTPPVTRILTSPLVRAVQSAEILSRTIPSHPAVAQSENLIPGFRVNSLLEELARLGEENLVAVGHQPDLTGLISHLLSGSRLNLEMQPGSLASLEVGPMRGELAGHLRWLLTPALIRSLNGNQ
jgi:phosphohistidine phosphatase